MEVVCIIDTGNLGYQNRAHSDELGGNRAPPKGGGDYRGIGLLNPMWKVVEKIMVSRLSCLKLHHSLHGGRRGLRCELDLFSRMQQCEGPSPSTG